MDDFVFVEGLTLKQHDDPIIDKMLGVIYGQVLGDAYGLATEFETKESIEKTYKGIRNIPFPDFIENKHNKRWHCDWTDDSDLMILIMESINESKGKVIPENFALKLFDWIHQGFPELGDKGGVGIGMNVCTVANQKNFSTDPHKASEFVWNKIFKRDIASNGSIMRISILGCHDYKDDQKVINNTVSIGKVTHWDPRCKASCLAVSLSIAWILRGKSCETSMDTVKFLFDLQTAIVTNCPEIKTPHWNEFCNYFWMDNIPSLRLDEEYKTGYTLKCMGAALFALKTDKKDFKTAVEEIIREGGDADSNAAPFGAILGAKIGYKKLPHDWIKHLKNKKWLDKRVIEFLKIQKLI